MCEFTATTWCRRTTNSRICWLGRRYCRDAVPHAEVNTAIPSVGRYWLFHDCAWTTPLLLWIAIDSHTDAIVAVWSFCNTSDVCLRSVPFCTVAPRVTSTPNGAPLCPSQKKSPLVATYAFALLTLVRKVDTWLTPPYISGPGRTCAPLPPRLAVVTYSGVRPALVYRRTVTPGRMNTGVVVAPAYGFVGVAQGIFCPPGVVAISVPGLAPGTTGPVGICGATRLPAESGDAAPGASASPPGVTTPVPELARLPENSGAAAAGPPATRPPANRMAAKGMILRAG